jgi:catechol 2,3-dioxygenase-like lactoylglutathione lyase family enzyme
MIAPAIDHIGIIVADLEAAITAWSRVLPGAPLTRRSLPDVGLEVAEFGAANVCVELLQYAANSDFARQVMGDEHGLNHVSVSVPDLDGALAALASEGIQPMQGFPRRGSRGQIAFLARDPRLHALVELCDLNKPHNAKEMNDAS